MSGAERLLAVLVAAAWGGNFVAIRLAVDHYPPFLFSTLRYALAALPILAFFPPPLPLWRLTLVAMPLLAGQFALLMIAVALGMPPGLASVVMQSQVMFTILMAAAFVGERPRRAHLAGAAVGMAGLAVIASTIGADVPPAAFAITFAAAFTWAVGNVLLRTLPRDADAKHLAVWMSAASVMPCAAAALVFEGPAAIGAALAATGPVGLATLLYNGVVVTLLAFWIWSRLMMRHPAGEVAPFALLVPVFGLVSTALAFGESHPPLRWAGMGLVVGGVALAVVPAGRRIGRLTKP
jgi:O-acetylserine/cysteine efflux transporter